MPTTLTTCADLAARPAGSLGDVVYQEDTKQIITYDGANWQEYGSDGTGGYDLDGTNVLTVSPLFHFDAELINGVDTSGNPSDGTAFAGQWTSRVGGKTTAVQGTVGSRPTFYTTGENSLPYLDFDGLDFLDLTAREYCGENLTFIVIAKADSHNYFNPVSTMGSDTGAIVSDLGTSGIFRGYSTGSLLFYSVVAQGYPGVIFNPTGKDFNTETRSVIYRKTAAGGSAYIDGDNSLVDGVGAPIGTSANDNDVRFGSFGRTTATNFMDGKIYEIILFNSYLSNADLNTWGAYVDLKYDTGTGTMEAQDGF